MKITNKYNMPEFIVNYMTRNLWKPKEKYIRVSELIKPPVIKWLTLKHWDSLEVDARSMFMAMLGDGIHISMKDAIEAPKTFEQYSSAWSEQILELDMDGAILKGAVDLYLECFDRKGILDDFKSTSTSALAFGAKESWERQTNVYAFLLNQYGRRVDNINIIVILRDWSEMKAYYNRSYPQAPVISMAIDLWDKQVAENYVKDRLEVHNKVMGMTIEELIAGNYGCPISERWHKDDTWACMKPDANRARKVCNSEEEAKENLKSGEIIQFRYAEDTYCKHYCSVSSVCPFINPEGVK